MASGRTARRTSRPGSTEMMQWKLTPDEVAAIRCPTLVTAAEHDMASSNARELYDAITAPEDLHRVHRRRRRRHALRDAEPVAGEPAASSTGSTRPSERYAARRVWPKALDLYRGNDRAMQHPRQYAETAPDRPAAIDADTGEVRTYRALDERANRLAGRCAVRACRPVTTSRSSSTTGSRCSTRCGAGWCLASTSRRSTGT